MKPVIRFSALTIAVCSVVGLSGCKLSDLIDSDESSKFVALQGTAATADGPMIGARVDIKDANGNEFAAYVDSSGYFSLTQDPDDEDEEYIELRAPLILSVDYNEQTYRSMLCNIVYSQFGDAIDTVNIHPLTEFVMAETAGTTGTDYANWTEGASETYCSLGGFVTSYNNIAHTLAGNIVTNPYSEEEYQGAFNFFNTLFNADGTGFDEVLDNFDPGMQIDEAPEWFRISNSLGSLNLLPGTSWNGTATGRFGADTINETGDNIQISITPDGLAETLEDLLSNQAENEIELQSLSISAEGLGIGEIGTTATVRLKGTAALVGASIVNRDFDITLELVRVEGGLVIDGPVLR